MKNKALALLREMTGNPSAEFHDGQLEAILELVNNHSQLLVVQKTGWGKSAVYFIATKLLRMQGRGPAIIISPLIALMRNQIERATQLDLNVVTVNSDQSKEERDFAKGQIVHGDVDAVIISPEQLAEGSYLGDALNRILYNVSLFVVDEAHCISDWGHDFRPDYRRIVRILKQMLKNVPVLATTATANDRVVTDIVHQLGDSLKVIRGDLKRDSLYLQNIPSTNRATRMAWLAKYIPQLKGSGIVYVKTIRDAELLAEWLKSKGINAFCYHGGSDSRERVEIENDLLHNRLKVLVSTSALGMGFDKPDLGFVIHFQMPSSVIEYYQQVGRAGRAIEHAYGILMNGPESDRIQKFFIESAFPNEDEIEQLLGALELHDGLTKNELEKNCNLRAGRIEAVLKFLNVESPSPIYQDGSKYFRNQLSYKLPYERINRVTALKKDEWNQLKDYHRSTSCLMKELTTVLDDPSDDNCGNCMNCDPNNRLTLDISRELVLEASEFMRHRYVKIEPRKQFGRSGALVASAFPTYNFRYRDSAVLASDGLALSRWRDGAWGDVVADDKSKGKFSDELIEPMITMIKSMTFDERPTWMTYVPSLRSPELVKSFAYRLADRLGIPCKDALVMVEMKAPQKKMHNSYQQSHNLDGAFDVDIRECLSEPVLLLDDAVDSGWTFTVTAALLRRAGASAVYPIALTSTATQEQGK